MASADIYSQFLRPARSVADYTADLDNADMRRMQIANAGQTNALNEMTMQDRQRATAEAMADQNALQRVASAARTPEDLITGLRNSGRPALMRMADDREKGMLERRKIEAEVGKIGAETAVTQGKTLDAKIDRFRAAVPYLESPQAIARWYQAQYQDPELGPVMQATHGPYEQVLQSMPKDPSQLQQWQQMTAMGMEKFLQEQRQRAEQAERERNNKEQNRLKARDQDITVRRDNMTDARAREANARAAEGGKPPAGYRWKADGSLEAIPGGPADTSTGGKPLAPGIVKNITEARDNAITIENLKSTFKPEFAGKGVFGLGADMQMGVSGNVGVDTDAVEWWKNYRKQAELIERHALFGAALTPTEQASWRSADIGPGMDPSVVARNLATRERLTKQVLEAARQDSIDAGHSEQRVNAIAGRKPATVAPAAPAASGFKIIKVSP